MSAKYEAILAKDTLANAAVDYAFGPNSIVCFAAGSRIETDRGLVPVQRLRPGMKVRTRDHGMQPVRGTGANQVMAYGDQAPVIIREGALGNARELAVPPTHPMLLTGALAQRLFGKAEVLVKAIDLVNGTDIVQVEGGMVSYHAILLDRQEVIYAEGVAAEATVTERRIDASVAAAALAALTAGRPAVHLN